jgi:hypothetical protein
MECSIRQNSENHNQETWLVGSTYLNMLYQDNIVDGQI